MRQKGPGNTPRPLSLSCFTVSPLCQLRGLLKIEQTSSVVNRNDS